MSLGGMPVPASVVGVGVILAALCVFSGFCVLRFAASQLAPPGPGRRCLILAAAGIGLLALGCRLTLASGNISWAPYLDQWGVEISGVVSPLAHGTLGWRELFAGNNEHRVPLTRALSLATILANGAWDNRVLVIESYLLQSFMVAWASALAWATLGWARGSYVAAAALLPMLLVCGWEGITSSNQAQFVLMAFGSVVAFSLQRGHSLRSPATWGSLALALLTLGSMASGFLTALALLATAFVMALAARQPMRSVAGYCAACAAIAALGWLTRAHFTALQALYASSAGGWLDAFLAYASWPLPPGFLWLLVLWLPWFVLLRRALVRREMVPLAPFAIGLGLWVLLQAGALAWARSGLSGLVSSRYTEFLGWGLVANAAALVLVLGGRGAGRGRLVAMAVMAAWLAGIGGAEAWRSRAIYQPYFTSFRVQTLEHEQRLGTFMRTGDATVINGTSFPHIPHYSPDLIVMLLGDPKVAASLHPRRATQLRRRPGASQRPVVRRGRRSLALGRPLLRAEAGKDPGCLAREEPLFPGRVRQGSRLVLAEQGVAGPGDQRVEGIPHEGRQDAQPRGRPPSPAKLGQGRQGARRSKHGGAAHGTLPVGHKHQAAKVGHRQPLGLQVFLRGRALQRRKVDAGVPVMAQEEPHDPVAQAALAIV
jgi:hypothetical protein